MGNPWTWTAKRWSTYTYITKDCHYLIWLSLSVSLRKGIWRSLATSLWSPSYIDSDIGSLCYRTTLWVSWILSKQVPELCKQTETNWSNFFFVLWISVVLSHEQRNDWCTIVSAHLGEQIEVEISNNSFFWCTLGMQVADVWMIRGDSNIIHRKPLDLFCYLYPWEHKNIKLV